MLSVSRVRRFSQSDCSNDNYLFLPLRQLCKSLFHSLNTSRIQCSDIYNRVIIVLSVISFFLRKYRFCGRVPLRNSRRFRVGNRKRLISYICLLRLIRHFVHKINTDGLIPAVRVTVYLPRSERSCCISNLSGRAEHTAFRYICSDTQDV